MIRKFIILIYIIMLCETTLLSGTKTFIPRMPKTPESNEKQLMGWELSRANTGLRGDYSGLTKLDLHGRDADVGRMNGSTLFVNAGKTIENKLIPYPLNLEAGGITIRKCLIQPTFVGHGMPFIITENVILEDSEIDGSRMPGRIMGMSIAVAGSGKIMRCDIHHSSTGISIGNSSGIISIAEGNYIHDLVYVAPAHVDGITTRISCGAGTIIRNNRIVLDMRICTGALFIQTTFGRIDNLLIEGNLLEGYGYTLAMDKSRFDYGKNIRIINNRFNPYKGGWGAVSVQKGISVSEAGENYYYEPSSDDFRGKIINVGQ